CKLGLETALFAGPRVAAGRTLLLLGRALLLLGRALFLGRTIVPGSRAADERLRLGRTTAGLRALLAEQPLGRAHCWATHTAQPQSQPRAAHQPPMSRPEYFWASTLLGRQPLDLTTAPGPPLLSCMMDHRKSEVGRHFLGPNTFSATSHGPQHLQKYLSCRQGDHTATMPMPMLLLCSCCRNSAAGAPLPAAEHFYLLQRISHGKQDMTNSSINILLQYCCCCIAILLLLQPLDCSSTQFQASAAMILRLSFLVKRDHTTSHLDHEPQMQNSSDQYLARQVRNALLDYIRLLVGVVEERGLLGGYDGIHGSKEIDCNL
ncbi:hypothetical protein Salat_2959700, partial [Sesamum alatum]